MGPEAKPNHEEPFGPPAEPPSSISANAEDAEFLRAVPIFSSLSSSALDELSARATRTTVRAGEHLFHQGDPSDSLFVVCSGRLEVMFVEPIPVLARVVTRGAVLGELGILTGSPRSASVRAKRDSELIEIRRDEFVRLLEGSPQFATGLARALGRELQVSRALATEVNPVPTTIAVVALGPDLPVNQLADGLGRALSEFGTVSVVRATEEAEEEVVYVRRLDERERHHDQVLLVAGTSDPPGWQDFCIRQADRVLALLDRRSPLAEAKRRGVEGCDLVCCEAAGKVALAPWFDALGPRAVWAVPSSAMEEQIAVMARRLTARSVGLVLSGGGARGCAHIGVIEELAASGVIVDRVVGCSIGALGAAALAAGMSPEEMAVRWYRNMVAKNPLNDYTVPAVALVRGRKLLDGLRDLFGSTLIEELPREFFCVSSDLHRGELYVHRRGPVVDAVYASMSIPGLLPPANVDGRVLVDGGVLNNLPVDALASRGEGPIVAVNLTVQRDQPATSRAKGGAGSLIRQALGRSMLWASPWTAGLQAALTGVRGPAPRLQETLLRVLLLGSVEAVRSAQAQADVVITPDIRGIGMLQFDALDRGIEAGRAAAREALTSEENRRRLLLTPGQPPPAGP